MGVIIMAESKPTPAASRKAETSTPFETQGPNSEPVVDPTNNASGRTGSDEDPTTANPVVTEGDRLAPNQTTSGNSPVPNGTGFHCGICGRPVGKEGQHYDGEGDEVASPHANVMVVADDWAEEQNRTDQEAAEKHAARRPSRRTAAEAQKEKAQKAADR